MGTQQRGPQRGSQPSGCIGPEGGEGRAVEAPAHLPTCPNTPQRGAGFCDACASDLRWEKDGPSGKVAAVGVGTSLCLKMHLGESPGIHDFTLKQSRTGSWSSSPRNFLLRMKKPRPREVKLSAQSHTAGERQDPGDRSGLGAPGSVLFLQAAWRGRG